MTNEHLEQTQETPHAEYERVRSALGTKREGAEKFSDEFLSQYEDYEALKKALEDPTPQPNAELEQALVDLEKAYSSWSEVARIKAFSALQISLRPAAESLFKTLTEVNPNRAALERAQYEGAAASFDIGKLTTAYSTLLQNFGEIMGQQGEGIRAKTEALTRTPESVFNQAEPFLHSLFTVNETFVRHFNPSAADDLAGDYETAVESGQIGRVQEVLSASVVAMNEISKQLSDGTVTNTTELLDRENDPFTDLDKAYAPQMEELLKRIAEKDSDTADALRGQYQEAQASKDNVRLIATFDAMNEIAISKGIEPVTAPEFKVAVTPETLLQETADQLRKGYEVVVDAQIPVIATRTPELAAQLQQAFDRTADDHDIAGMTEVTAMVTRAFVDPEFRPSTDDRVEFAMHPRVVSEPIDWAMGHGRVETEPSPSLAGSPDFVSELKSHPEKYTKVVREGDLTTIDLTVPDRGSRIQHIVGPEGSGAVVSLPAAELGQTVLKDSRGTEYRWDGNTWSHEGRRLLVGPSYETKIVMSKKAPSGEEAADKSDEGAKDEAPKGTPDAPSPAVGDTVSAPDALPHAELASETPEEKTLRDQTHYLLDQVFTEGKEAKLTPQIDAALKGKHLSKFNFKVNDDLTLTATLELTDASGKVFKYSDTSVAHVSAEGYVYKKIAFPFNAAPDRLKALPPERQLIELNMSRRQALKGMLRNLASGKTVA